MAPETVPVIDIRQARTDGALIEQLFGGLNPSKGTEMTLPTLLLYDEKGLKLFEEITYIEEYYPTAAEIEVLQVYANDIVNAIEADALLVELGAGNLRKVKILLDAFEKAEKPIKYFALDLSLPELRRTLGAVEGRYCHVQCFGLLGTYDDGLSWIKNAENMGVQKCVLSLGSSIGNFSRTDAAQFLRDWADALDANSLLIVGLDGCQDGEKILRAYNDPQGVTHRFILNGLNHANRLLGATAFDPPNFKVFGEYEADCHRAWVVPSHDFKVGSSVIPAGSRLKFEESHKYPPRQSQELWRTARLEEFMSFANATNEYHLHLLKTMPPSFPCKVSVYAPEPVPLADEFEKLWKAWDFVSLDMIPHNELLVKPIHLRNAFIFYLGHIPAFLDIHVTRAIEGPPTEPATFQTIFERGIDPNVEDPAQCHAHSEVPETWPSMTSILSYQEAVRTRLRSLYDSQWDPLKNRRVARALWLAFEHEAMHLETFLYMLTQSDKTLPPTKKSPDFQAMAAEAMAKAVPNDWIKIPVSPVEIGVNDPENDEGPDRFFGWDNEKPTRTVRAAAAFEAKARPITNGDFAEYLQGIQSKALPASWLTALNVEETAPGTSYIDGKFVKTVYGPVALRDALSWPVWGSYDELDRCARFFGGRIPTVEECHSLYQYAELRKQDEADGILSRKISAVNGHLSENGVATSPTSTSSSQSVDPYRHFVDLKGCNVGLQNWHPVPVTPFGGKLCGRSELGGVWEWTSSALQQHEGFEAGELYPAYTDDFFDGKHNIVLGSSWATHPRIGGRRSFVNWFQRSYPYAFVGARIVREVPQA